MFLLLLLLVDGAAETPVRASGIAYYMRDVVNNWQLVWCSGTLPRVFTSLQLLVGNAHRAADTMLSDKHYLRILSPHELSCWARKKINENAPSNNFDMTHK